MRSLPGLAFICFLAFANARAELPRDVQLMLDDLHNKVELQAQAAELLTTVAALYREGETLYESGRLEEAKVKFAGVRRALVRSEEEVFYQPHVYEYFRRVSRRLAQPEAETSRATISDQIIFSPNPEVQKFVKYYQGKGQGQVQVALRRLAKYEGMMRNIFREEGVPDDLIYVGLVESAYNCEAESSAGASGIWQFISATARRYGLKQTRTIDERHDPEKSTRAAARYLRDLYEIFRDWNLALAAYNSGEYRVLRIMERTGIKNFWEMRRRGLLPQETREYVPAVLAAMLVLREERRS